MGVLLPTVRHVFIENLIVVDVLVAKDRPDRHSLAFDLVVESLEAMTLIHTAVYYCTEDKMYAGEHQ